MEKRKKINKILLVILFGLSISSCTTELMWQDSHYKESITHFMITEDGSQIAVIGKSYHYIFPASKALKEVLLSDYRQYIKPSFHYFKVNQNNIINGSISLQYTDSLHPPPSDWLTNLNFKANNSKTKYIFREDITGTRYMTNDLSLNKKHQFNKPYIIEVTEETSTSGKAAKALATPITVAIDGVVVIGVMAALFISYEHSVLTGQQ